MSAAAATKAKKYIKKMKGYKNVLSNGFLGLPLSLKCFVLLSHTYTYIRTGEKSIYIYSI